jgi:hypothetical protein
LKRAKDRENAKERNREKVIEATRYLPEIKKGLKACFSRFRPFGLSRLPDNHAQVSKSREKSPFSFSQTEWAAKSRSAPKTKRAQKAFYPRNQRHNTLPSHLRGPPRSSFPENVAKTSQCEDNKPFQSCPKPKSQDRRPTVGDEDVPAHRESKPCPIRKTSIIY